MLIRVVFREKFAGARERHGLIPHRAQQQLYGFAHAVVVIDDVDERTRVLLLFALQRLHAHLSTKLNATILVRNHTSLRAAFAVTSTPLANESENMRHLRRSARMKWCLDELQ